MEKKNCNLSKEEIHALMCALDYYTNHLRRNLIRCDVYEDCETYDLIFKKMVLCDNVFVKVCNLYKF